MSVGFPSSIENTAWSPCNKFIAIAWDGSRGAGGVGILDAVTLRRLSVFPAAGLTMCLIFSPDTCSLTWLGYDPENIVSRDVQTGVLISVISLEPLSWPEGHSKIIYSTCGTMLGLSSYKAGGTTISTYNILSGTCIYSHSVEVWKLAGIWAHNECLQFATKEPGTLTIWEAGFIPTHTLTKIKSLQIPPEVHRYDSSYNSTLSWLICKDHEVIFVWDIEHSKYLLDPVGIRSYSEDHTSPDYPYFLRDGSGVNLWKEPSTAYVLHQMHKYNTSNKIRYTTMPYISPNGELAFTHRGSVVQLWHTTNFSTRLLTIPTQPSQRDRKSSLLRFSPDEALAAVLQKVGMVVTVLDLKSDTPRLIIDTGMEVYGLGMARGTIVVVGPRKIVTWNLPARGCVLSPRVNMNNSVRTVTYDYPRANSKEDKLALVSPDLHCVTLTSQDDTVVCSVVDLYDVLTGRHLGHGEGRGFTMSSFTPDGGEFWHVDNDDGSRGNCWKILKDGKSNAAKLGHPGRGKTPMDTFHWQCPPGYKVTDDGWILQSSGKRLLWLPTHWWPDWWDRAWHGQFLALLNDGLPELLILELE